MAQEPWEKRQERALGGGCWIGWRSGGSGLMRRGGRCRGAWRSWPMTWLGMRTSCRCWRCGRGGRMCRLRSRWCGCWRTRPCRSWRRTGTRTPGCGSGRRGRRPGGCSGLRMRGRRSGRSRCRRSTRRRISGRTRTGRRGGSWMCRRSGSSCIRMRGGRPIRRRCWAGRGGITRSSRWRCRWSSGSGRRDGWADERLVPLVAGLAEVQPWVDQWHGEVDPSYGVSLAAFCREQLTARAAQVGTDAGGTGRVASRSARARPPG